MRCFRALVLFSLLGGLAACPPRDSGAFSVTLRMLVQGNGSGRVTQAEPIGKGTETQAIDCAGKAAAADICRLDVWVAGKSLIVDLVARADEGSKFVGWSGECGPSTASQVSVTLDENLDPDISCAATFDLIDPSDCKSDEACVSTCTTQCEGPPETSTCNLTAKTCDCTCPEPPTGCSSDAACVGECTTQCQGAPESATCNVSTGECACTCPECIPACAAGACNVTDGCGGELCECEDTEVCDLETSVCEAPCAPSCAPDTCNVGDGCGGICGCSDTQTCNAETFLCDPPCEKTCGPGDCDVDDGCGGTCGCSPSQICDLGTHTCTPPCTTECKEGACGGDDGCGGSCVCETGEGCDFETETCGDPCAPSCEPGACLVGDGCGGKCECPEGEVCELLTKTCGAACVPSCSPGTCGGSDGCTGTCGCGVGETCNAETKSCAPTTCTPTCAPGSCAVPDGCNGTCGCSAGEHCVETAHQCFPNCTPSCAAGACGVSDGCDGTCACSGGQTCDLETKTCGAACTPTCTPGACGGSDGCDGTCGCIAGNVCNPETNTCGPCQPSCDGTCGDDGCGGTCTCPGNQQCNEGTQLCGPCEPSCDGTCAIPDGCGGTCACGGFDVCNAATKLCDACEPECTPGVCGIDDLCGGFCGCPNGQGCDTGSATCMGPPLAPTGVVATAGQGAVTLTWTAVSGATGYTIYMGFSPGVTPANGAATPAAASPQTIAGLAPGLPVYFVVTVTTSTGQSAPSTEVSATPTAEPDLVAPELIFTAPHDGSFGANPATPIRAVFSEPLDPATLTAGFTLAGPGGPIAGTVTQVGQTLSFTPTAALPLATHFTATLATTLRDLTGNALAAPRTFGFTTRALPPTGVTVIEGYYAATLRWNAVPGASGYAISRSDAADGPFTLIGGSLRPSYTDRTLGSGDPYFYRITALTPEGESGATASLEAVADPFALQAPSSPTARPGNGSALILWNSGGADVTYTLLRSPSANAPYAVIAADLETVAFRDTGLTNGTRYSYVVQAHGAAPDSVWSEEAQVIPSAALPASPSGLTATPGSGWVSLTWTAVPGAIGYVVYAITDDPASPSDGHNQKPVVAASVTTNQALIEVTDGTEYYLSVATLGAGSVPGVPSAEILTQPQAVLAPRPTTLLQAYPSAHGVIHLGWAPAPGAFGYHILRAESSGGPYTEVATAYSTTYNDTALVAGLYAYVIEPFSTGGTPATASNELVAEATEGPELAPTGLAAQPGQGCISLTWDPAVGASEYSVARAITATGPYTGFAYPTGQYGTLALDCTVADATPYYFVVRAYTNGVYSDYSDPLLATASTTRPASPTPTVTAGDGQLAVTWASTGAASYHVFRRTGASAWAELTETTARHLIDDAVVNHVPYRYALQAEAADGQLGALVQYAADLAPSSHATRTPTGLTGQPGNGCVTLSWDVIAEAQGYQVTRMLPDGSLDTPVYFDGTFANRYTRCGLTNGTPATFRVTAWSAVTAYSAYSAAVTVTPAAARPIAPAVATSIVGSGAVALTWPSSGTGVTYHVYRRTPASPWQDIAQTTALTYVDASANNGSTYTYALQSENVAGLGALSNGLLPSAPSASPSDVHPPAPQGMFAEPGKGCVTIGWDATPGAYGYEIYRATASLGAYEYLDYFDGTTANRYTECGLTNGIARYYLVRSWSAAQGGYSGYSAEVSATPLVGLPASPAATPAVGNAQVDLQWTAAAGATAYHVFRRDAATPWQEIASVPAPRYSDHSVANDTSYTYALRTQSAAGLGALSDGKLQSLPAALPKATLPVAPAHFAARAGNHCVTLTWDPVPGAEYYQGSYAPVAGGASQIIPDVQGETHNAMTVCALQNGTPYRFAVRAWTPEGAYGAASLEATATPLGTLPETPQSAPTVQLAGAGALMLTWTAAPGALIYRIHRRDAATPWTLIGQSATPAFTDTGLLSGTYSYAIQPAAPTGVGALSPASAPYPL